MGDRNNPIKFGPEWLRNLAREGNAAGTSGNSTNSGATTNPSGSGNTASGSSSSHAHTSNVSNPLPKVQLAKLRYGREEMLALYDRNAEAPPELKFIELLYQPRGKAPFALNNTFEDEMQRERSGPPGPPGSNAPGDRFGMGRGMGRCLSVSDGRGRPRVPFVRTPSTGRGSSWHPTNPKLPGYSGGPEDDAPLNTRSSWAANNGAGPPNRSSGEQPEWNPNKVFRSKRQGQVNWRQSREEGEEWRSTQEAGRLRSNQQEKWERDWGDRPPQDRQSQSWNSNRRTWVGGDAQNEENLPEWAVENAEAGGGTFDSSGAFHGYSNDDTNLPKLPESAYPLTRSHTHGSFVRSKTIEEGSEEWWASEKAKKLSPKRFDASDVKFKKQMSAPESNNDTGAEQKPSTSKDDNQLQEVPEKLEKSSAASEPPENATGGYCDDEKLNIKNTYKPKFPSENKTFDSHMRSDMNHEEASDGQHERGGNFQSVMIPPNNSLRQKHQNIVAAAAEVNRDIIVRDKQVILKLLQNAPTSQAFENEMRKQQQATEDKIVDEIFDMTLEEKELLSKTKPISSPINQSSGNMSASMSSLVNSMAQVPNPGMQQMRLASPHYSNQGISLNTKQNMQNPGMQGMPSGMQGMPSGMQAMQMQGLQMGLPPTLQQVAGMQALSMQVNMQQAAGNQQQGMKGAIQSSGMQSGAMPGNMQAGMQNSGLQGPMQSSLQSVGITNAALNASLGLPIGPVSISMGLPLQGVPPPVLSNSGMNPAMAGPGMQGLGPGGLQASGTGMPGFPSGSLLGMSSANVANSSLFMGQNSNSSMNTGDIPMPNHGGQNNMYSMHGLQHSGSQAAFGSSIYSNMMQQPPSQPPPNPQNLVDQWYYEDPEKNIQGPFSSNEMYKWYRAGFFSPSLMVRRAVDNHMRPLGSYGPVVPFLQMNVMAAFPMAGAFERTPGSHESMMNAQQALGLESKSRFQVDSLWSQPPPNNDLMWAQQAMGARNDARVNNLPMFFWDQQVRTLLMKQLIF